MEPVLKRSTSTKRLPFPVGDYSMEVLLYMPGMGFNGPVFWPVSWIHAYACASRNLAPLTWFNFMLRNAAQSITANSTCGIRDCREMFTSMLVPISVVDNSIDMIEIAESTSVGYA